MTQLATAYHFLYNSRTSEWHLAASRRPHGANQDTTASKSKDILRTSTYHTRSSASNTSCSSSQDSRCSQTGTTPFSFHVANPTAITTLTAPANHNAVDIPTFPLLVQPPIIPPKSKVATEAMRRFLFTFSLASKCGSETRSQYKLVRTVVGTSFNPSSLLVTI